MFARFVLSFFGFGLVPVAPGTFGTLGAALAAGAILAWAPQLAADWQLLAGAWIVTASALTILLTPVVEVAAGAKDPGVIVTDEVAGYWATLLFLPDPGPGHLAVAFFVFRFLDIVKPWPGRRLEALPGGWGVLLDDLWAGLLGGGALWALDRFTG